MKIIYLLAYLLLTASTYRGHVATQ